ncbi:laminin subunit alpha-3 isoform X1 [Misgurnus anguillicaudatus]|uniref:laminin subunit alpha-3 isoform X1 n=1 Tax=Misgurnus anguillicaudatus TaxID=75329 RepID=UPI003CCFD16B
MSKTNRWMNAIFRAVLIGVLLGTAFGGPRQSDTSTHRDPHHGQQTEVGQRIYYPVIHEAQKIHDTQQILYPSLNDGQQTCLYNTAGDKCERCKDGYYGNATQRTCRVCPCPLSTEANGFAVGCSETSDGRVQCLCKVGYTGERCERCAPGFYGDPRVFGGRCRPCNCPKNSCDSLTGVCKNFLELQNTETDEQCEECDNCAHTLLSDLEKFDIDLKRLKDQLDLDSVGSSVKDDLRKLEDAITNTTNLVNIFSSTVNKQGSKINQLERDVINLAEDMNDLKEQARKRSDDSQKALVNVENSHERAKDLETETQNLHKKIQDLLKQLTDANIGESTPLSGDLQKLLQESERMVKEMQNRNFTPLKDNVKKERDQANKLLEQVNDFTKQCDENKDASKRVEGLLESYEMKVKELEDSLKQAVNMVKQASGLNDVNAVGLQDVVKQLKDLENERDLVRNQIGLAVDQLKNTEDLLKMFNDSKTDYEDLTKQLDSAKTDLKDKVKVISQAKAQEKIVKQAEEHAENLRKLSKELQEAVQNVSGLSGVQDALSGIDIYKNITDAVNAAEEAANKAKEAADKALREANQGDLIKRVTNLKDTGNNLLKNATDAVRDLKGATKDLNNQMKRLQDDEKKKKLLEETLRSLQDDLRKIQRDDIDNIINAAKKAAVDANLTTTNTMDELNDIKAEVKKISISPSVSNIDNVLQDVDVTVKNLSASIPSLLDKINELTSQLTAVNNVSDNINRIKELIEQAREAANRIVVPMKFSGNGFVELRPPKDIDDLRAYTALTLALQRSEKTPNRGRRRRRQISTDQDNMFVFYLGHKNGSGDYIGMALRNNLLRLVYKLNGKEYDIETSNITESPSEPAFFDKIVIQRVYQDAEVIHTQQFTSSNPKSPQIEVKQGDLIRNLLDLSPDDVVFYVGGYPDDFKPPISLNIGKYKGCIEFSTFNEKFISLYNFKNAVNINLETPCKRHIPVTGSESTYFEGSGYVKIMLEKFPKPLQIIQKIDSRSEDALLIFIRDENDEFFYSVSLERGYIVVQGQEKGQVLSPFRSLEKVKLSPEIEVRVIINLMRDITVRVGQTEVKTSGYSPTRFLHYFVGGIPNILRERYNITVPALKGCVKGGMAGGISQFVKEEVGIGKGCSQDLLVVRKAEFTPDSALEKVYGDFSLQDDINLSLGFKSIKPDGILMQNTKANKHIQLSMEKGYVMLKLQDSMWKSTKTYQDGKWHYLTVVRQGQRVELRVDEDDVGERLAGSSSEVYSSSITLGKDTFKGCISNLYLRRPEALYKPEDLSSYTATGDVMMDTCSAKLNI